MLEVDDGVVEQAEVAGRNAEPQLDRTEVGQCPGSVHHVVAAVRTQPFDQRGDVVTGVEPNAQVNPDREDEHAAVRRRLPSDGRAQRTEDRGRLADASHLGQLPRSGQRDDDALGGKVLRGRVGVGDPVGRERFSALPDLVAGQAQERGVHQQGGEVAGRGHGGECLGIESGCLREAGLSLGDYRAAAEQLGPGQRAAYLLCVPCRGSRPVVIECGPFGDFVSMVGPRSQSLSLGCSGDLRLSADPSP
ncbi:MAG TPA: hypothetical protein VIC62_13675, partial [Nakamurella sp.]